MAVALICGITGQDGGFLAELLLSKHYDVFGTSRRDRDQFNNSFIPPHIKSQIHLPSADLTDFNTVNDLVKTIHPDEIYNLSGLSSVGLSFEQPIEAMRSIAESTLNVLEVIHKAHSPARFYNAGSTECFGDTQAQAPADENTALRPRSPYGVAKAAAMMHVANYREAYGVFASSGILSNHESLRRPQSFVIHKVVSAAVAIAQGRHQRLVLGNMDIVRDWGWAPEYVEAMWRILQQDEPQDYLISTGESHSLRSMVGMAFDAVGLRWQDHVDVDPSLLRPTDILATYANPKRARENLNWTAATRANALIQKLVAEEADRCRLDLRPQGEVDRRQRI